VINESHSPTGEDRQSNPPVEGFAGVNILNDHAVPAFISPSLSSVNRLDERRFRCSSVSFEVGNLIVFDEIPLQPEELLSK